MLMDRIILSLTSAATDMSSEQMKSAKKDLDTKLRILFDKANLYCDFMLILMSNSTQNEKKP